MAIRRSYDRTARGGPAAARRAELLPSLRRSGILAPWCVTCRRQLRRRAWLPHHDFQSHQTIGAERSTEETRCEVVYAVVRAGGRQEKVQVGTIVVLDRQAAKVGDKIELPAVLFVDGDAVTTDADKLAKVKVTAEVLGEERGPKIVIQKFKNKTGYKKRQGHRQDLTRVKITGIK